MNLNVVEVDVAAIEEVAVATTVYQASQVVQQSKNLIVIASGEDAPSCYVDCGC